MTSRAGRGQPPRAKGNGSAAPGKGRRDAAAESVDPRPVLLLGIGNILYGDEGLGVYVVHRLRRAYRIPSSLRIIDGGAAGPHLEPIIAEARRVFVIDAVAGTIGSIYRFGHHDMPSVVRDTAPMSHETALESLLKALEERGELPPTRIIAMGVTPSATPAESLAMGLTPEIEARLPALELVLLAELAEAGVLLEPRNRPASPSRGRTTAGRGRRRREA